MPLTGGHVAGSGDHVGDHDLIDAALALLAPLASPALTGAPTAPTQTSSDSTTKLATTAFVATAVSTVTGAVTSVAGHTGAVVLVESDIASLVTDLAAKASLVSPTFTGTPAAPTVSGTTDSTTKIASTAFVQAVVALLAPLASPIFTGTALAPTPSAGDNTTKVATTAFVANSFQLVWQVVATAFAATVTPAVNAKQRQILNIGALTGNITIANPTGTPTDGQTLQIRMLQDGTGSRTVSFGTSFAFGTDVTTSLIPSAANSKWEMLFQWNATDSKWRAMSIVRGF